MDNFDHYELSESSSAPDSDVFMPNTPTPPEGSSSLLTAITTWAYSRPGKPNEPKRSGDGRNRIFYCKLCLNPSYSCQSLISARYHLRHSHQIRVADTETKAKRLREDRLQNIWAMAEEKNLALAREREANGLQAVLNKQALQQALVQLIVLRNLPYNAVEWPELQALLMTVNYTVGPLLKQSHGDVPRMIKNSFIKTPDSQASNPHHLAKPQE
ncbi:hypothetical protein V1517DRAFT_329795 [Lipomyces orientalis]|uniref:Uncharacterized protein n=1 Tax=Lipomyces orientalis TaxID=1233043 RepID=A0ACC3TJI1_9ASCO